MHNTRVTLKDGRVLEGPIWEWQPRDGYFTIPSVMDDRIYFRDCASAVTPGQRISLDVVGERDELERAREAGWDGK